MSQVTIEYNGEEVSLPPTKENREQLSEASDEIASMFRDARKAVLKDIVEEVVGFSCDVHHYDHKRGGPWVRVTSHGRTSMDKGIPQDIAAHENIQIVMIRDKNSSAKHGVYVGFMDD